MKYIGPFLRINSLGTDNIEKQLLYFSRESFKHILLNSRCGITTNVHQLKMKNIPNFDSNIFKKNSPLLCIYKKANPKIKADKESAGWDEDTFKKEITISSNAYMNLMLMDTSKYYNSFEEIDNKLMALGKIYSHLSIKQLDFFSSYLRNEDGVFVDKKLSSDEPADQPKFEDKDKKFKFSDQALMMAAYYKASNLPDNSDGEAYKSFSLDILNMFLNFNDKLYDLSLEEVNKLCFAFNIFYEESRNADAKPLLIDLYDLLIDKFNEESSIKIENLCMLYINLHFAHNNLSLLKFKDERDKAFETLNSLYDNEKGLFIKNADKKDMEFSAQEVVLYTLCQFINTKDNPNASTEILGDVYKRQLVNSGLIASWPDSPTLDSAEKYRDYSRKSEDLLEDNCFRMPSIPTPESCETAPIFIKSVNYSRKKEVFEPSKNTFDSSKNMPLLYMIHYIVQKFS